MIELCRRLYEINDGCHYYCARVVLVTERSEPLCDVREARKCSDIGTDTVSAHTWTQIESHEFL